MHLSKRDYGVLESGAILILSDVDWMSIEKRPSSDQPIAGGKLLGTDPVHLCSVEFNVIQDQGALSRVASVESSTLCSRAKIIHQR